MGMVSGIVMSYQFGTNWSQFSRITGNVIGPLMAYEVVAAFFLEAAFLGILLFGRRPRHVDVSVLDSCRPIAGCTRRTVLRRRVLRHELDGGCVSAPRFRTASRT